MKQKRKPNNQKRIKNILILIYGMFGFLVLILLYKMKIAFTGSKDIARGCDAMGCGHFGAPRGTRKHNGFDIAINPWETIKAPFKMKILRFGKVYPSITTDLFDLVEFTGFGIFSLFKFKLMYTDSVKYRNVGEILEKGEVLGNAQDIASFHGGGMINHIHLEVRLKGVLINPKLFLKL